MKGSLASGCTAAALGFLLAWCAAPSAAEASSLTSAYCKVREHGFSSYPTPGRSTFSNSVGIVLFNPGPKLGTSVKFRVDLIDAQGHIVVTEQSPVMSTMNYVRPKSEAYAVFDVETDTPIVKIKVFVRCKVPDPLNTTAPNAPPAMKARGSIESRSEGYMTVTGTVRNTSATQELGWPVLVLRNAAGRIVGGSTTHTSYTNERVGLIRRGETRPWRMVIPDVPTATSLTGLVGDSTTYMHWT
jgi:hypothetical protein